MFPEITRDEVFRIETQRLWLRWPVRADAAALAAIVSQACRDGGAAVADVNTQAVEKLIAAWRAEMEAGHGLHLVLELKAGARAIVGIIHSGSERCAIAREQRRLGDEAAEALEAMSARLGVRSPPRRTPPMAQQRIVAPLLAGCCLQA